MTSLAAAVLVTAASDGLLTRPETVLLLLCVGYLTVIVTCLGRVDDSGKLTVAAECSRLPMLALLVPPAV
ncbi:hypothetical protein ACFQER_11535 [Halomicroarcula sp. GCM10025894]|uniref:hypothetical protein n=1 Tax=Halomicroarcula sp. GCM10025894 TaxID=3252673 RepID=UPI003618D0E7